MITHRPEAAKAVYVSRRQAADVGDKRQVRA
jgi:hypothetical protein